MGCGNLLSGPNTNHETTVYRHSGCDKADIIEKSTFITTCRPLSGPVLRDTARLSQRYGYPPIARYGVFGVSTWPIGCDTPSPFSQRFPLGEHSRSGGAIPPLKTNISAILARYHMKTRQRGCDTSLCDTISKGYCAIWGGISHWAAKVALSQKESGKRSLVAKSDEKSDRSCRSFKGQHDWGQQD